MYCDYCRSQQAIKSIKIGKAFIDVCEWCDEFILAFLKKQKVGYLAPGNKGRATATNSQPVTERTFTTMAKRCRGKDDSQLDTTLAPTPQDSIKEKGRHPMIPTDVLPEDNTVRS